LDIGCLVWYRYNATANLSCAHSNSVYSTQQNREQTVASPPQFHIVIGKGRQDVLTPLAGHNEERPIIPQPHCGRCHRAGTGQATLEVIGSKWSNALT